MILSLSFLLWWITLANIIAHALKCKIHRHLHVANNNIFAICALPFALLVALIRKKLECSSLTRDSSNYTEYVIFMYLYFEHVCSLVMQSEHKHYRFKHERFNNNFQNWYYFSNNEFLNILCYWTHREWWTKTCFLLLFCDVDCIPKNDHSQFFIAFLCGFKCKNALNEAIFIPYHLIWLDEFLFRYCRSNIN